MQADVFRRTRIGPVVFSVFALAHPALAQKASPVAEALREMFATMSPRIALAAQTMPADKYDERVSSVNETFGETVAIIANYSSHYCYSLTGARDPIPSSEETHRRDSIVVHLKAKLEFCRTALTSLVDAGLADTTVLFDERKTKAALVEELVAFWAARYEYLSTLMRRSGVVPPFPCSGSGGLIDCGSGLNLCAPFHVPGRGRLTAVLSDAPYAVRSDGKGPYRYGTSNVRIVAASIAGVVVLGDPWIGPVARRGVFIDLDHPVAGDIGVPLGVIRDDQNLEVAGQWDSDPVTRRPRSLLEVPIGATVQAGQIDVEFHINGVVHDLQAGPQPVGHCYSDATAVHGRGTSTGTITHPDSLTWVVELPPGSKARLFDVNNRYPYAVDKGLYYVSLRLTVTR